VKRKKRTSETAVASVPPPKSRLLEKTDTSPKNVSASAVSSYDFDLPVTSQPLVPRVPELEVRMINCITNLGHSQGSSCRAH